MTVNNFDKLFDSSVHSAMSSAFNKINNLEAGFNQLLESKLKPLEEIPKMKQFVHRDDFRRLEERV